jgi:hypothetical protein
MFSFVFVVWIVTVIADFRLSGFYDDEQICLILTTVFTLSVRLTFFIFFHMVVIWRAAVAANWRHRFLYFTLWLSLFIIWVVTVTTQWIGKV